jgi:hypothetical protein
MITSFNRLMRRGVLGLLFGSFYVIVSCQPADDPKDPQVTKDESIYINEISSAGEDWIELYNATDVAKDLGGYKIYDDVTKKYTLPTGTTIQAKGFLVLICDDSGIGLNTNFKLSSSGETVFLENKTGEIIDKVTFPALDKGQSYGRYPDGSTSFKVSGNVSRGTTNGETNAPAIDNVVRNPLVPKKDESITFTATPVSLEGIASVVLYYRINGGSYQEKAMTLSSSSYVATVPAFNALGKVDYYVKITNTRGQSAYKPFDAPTDSYSLLLNEDALPNLFINEFLASNVSGYADNSSGTAEYDDWIEIYNASDVAVNIGGLYLSDDSANPFKSKIPNNAPSVTTIQPGGYLILWADGTPGQGPTHLNFSLSAAGEEIGIYYIDGRTIDQYYFGEQTADRSMGRSPDGSSLWKQFITPTPGASNQ